MTPQQVIIIWMVMVIAFLSITPLSLSQLFLRDYCILIVYGKQVWADVSKAAEVCRPLGYWLASCLINQSIGPKPLKLSMGGWVIETIAQYFLVVHFITEQKTHRFYGCCRCRPSLQSNPLLLHCGRPRKHLKFPWSIFLRSRWSRQKCLCHLMQCMKLSWVDAQVVKSLKTTTKRWCWWSFLRLFIFRWPIHPSMKSCPGQSYKYSRATHNIRSHSWIWIIHHRKSRIQDDDRSYRSISKRRRGDGGDWNYGDEKLYSNNLAVVECLRSPQKSHCSEWLFNFLRLLRNCRAVFTFIHVYVFYTNICPLFGTHVKSAVAHFLLFWGCSACVVDLRDH